MSLNSTPGHTSSSSYDSHYDPNFTAEISSKMHVPDKICVFENTERQENNLFHLQEVKATMNVPERIVVAGDNKHIALRESLPELKFDTPFPYHLQDFVLAAPPDVLTVDEYPYPSVDMKSSNKAETKTKATLDQTLNSTVDFNESSIGSNYAPEEEVAILRRQVRHLSRRVLTIEQENQQRQQREIIMYTLGVAYFFIKGIAWLHKHF